MAEMSAEIKAMLMSTGTADIDEALLGDYSRPAISIAGSGAGSQSFFISSGGRRVRLSVDKSSPLRVTGDPCQPGGGVILIMDGRVLFEGILEPALIHCPDQAYISISDRCAFGCSFCPVPKLGGRARSSEEVLGLVAAAMETGKLRAISILPQWRGGSLMIMA
jgi:biotin synthase-related radical SAM superfamily protein